jgi:alkanesulfonate monooxygenase SsuD/methylene tetrahydromethanopterin reductase-like flavin-dependent oxidoreductase (luciferase family)
MKVSMFHLMPLRDLPADFEHRYRSVWVDVPWHELTTAQRVGQFYNQSLDELIFAARSGIDGVCVNEHHQNAYGMMPSPNLMGAILARQTAELDVACIQLGATLPNTSPPIRIAEEYAMLDCISGGRIVAGMPLGTPFDANYCYGISPLEQRERYYEAHDLIIKAWKEREPFAWNGKYTQLPMVNLWPRPVQAPHPPIWVPGSGSLSTWEFTARHDYCYCFLSYHGIRFGKSVMDKFWEFSAKNGHDANPYRTGFLQLVAVSETDEQAERDYYEHIRYFYDKTQHVAPEFTPPGHQDYPSMVNTIRNQVSQVNSVRSRIPQFKFRDFVDNQMVIAGSPATVREQLAESIRSLRVGNLMVLLQIGSMPHELTLKNIHLFCTEVLPYLRGIWDEEGWENKWWPEKLRGPRGQPADPIAPEQAKP